MDTIAQLSQVSRITTAESEDTVNDLLKQGWSLIAIKTVSDVAHRVRGVRWPQDSYPVVSKLVYVLGQ
jgi:hypothetical protein